MRIYKHGALLLLFLLTGCTNYYQITDLSSKRTYYTTDYDRTDSGVIQFEDARTRANVTIQSSEIREVTRQQFEADPKAADAFLKVGDAPTPQGVPAPQVAAWANVCRVILNLHETVTRE